MKRFARGDRRISAGTVESILAFADGVSGDVQELCDALWEVSDEGAEISDADIPKALKVVFARERNGFDAAVADLTPNQFTVLRGLAELGDVGVYSDEFMRFVQKASPGAVKRALNRLESCRLVYVYHKGYRFANPFFKEWIKTEL